MATIFTKIIHGEIPSYKIAENEEFYAFLDIFPIAKGHTLVVPKAEIDYIFDLDEAMLGRMMVFAKQVAKALKIAVPCKKIGIAVIGLEVNHAHIHLVPVNEIGDLNFEKTKLKLAEDEFKTIQEAVKTNL
ncbi:MAG TPA: HIT family protein [Bacteroidales bacterium]|nr:HIT family protein [Bacteroidales bacterium]